MSGRLSDRDLIAKLPDLSGEPLGYPSAIPFNEMVGTKLAVAHAVPEDVVGRCENRSGDRHHRLHRSPSRPEEDKLRLRVRAFGACRAPCALDEDRLEPRDTLAQARGTAFASAFVHPRTEPRPRHQVLRRREAAHVDANFRNEHGGRRFADGGYRHQELELRPKGLELPRNLLVELVYGALQVIDRVEMLAQQEPVVRRDTAAQRFSELLLRAPQPLAAECSKLLRVILARDDGFENPPAAHAEDVRDHRRQLDVGVLQHALHALRMLTDLAHELTARPRQVAELLNRRRRNHAGSDEAVRQQIGDPRCVVHVALATRDVTDVRRVRQHQLGMSFEHVPYRLPVHARRLHGHVRAPQLHQPCQQLEQPLRRGLEATVLALHSRAILESCARHYQILVNVETCTPRMEHLHVSPPGAAAGVRPQSSKSNKRAPEQDPRGSSSWRQFTVLVGPPVRLTYGLVSAKMCATSVPAAVPPIMHPFPPSRCAEGSWRLTWGSAPHPGSVACGDPTAPRRSLAGARVRAQPVTPLPYAVGPWQLSSWPKRVRNPRFAPHNGLPHEPDGRLR